MSSTTTRISPRRLVLSSQPSRRRLFALMIVVVLMFSLVVVKLADLQVVSSDDYREYGNEMRIRSIALAADRGTIFDRNGRDLALSVPQQTIWADPREITDASEVARVASALAPILGKDYAKLQADINEYKVGQKSFMYIARKVDDQTANAIKALKLPGIHMLNEPKRFLAGDSKLASLIGTVDLDNKGQGGIEGKYDKLLTGKAGSMRVEQDVRGRDIPGGLRKENAAVRGDDIMLTIDSDLQYKVESALAHGIKSANARGGMAAVMDSETGEILAIANLTRDEKSGEIGAADRNMALTNAYEPGSMSKLITISAALETGIVNPSTRFEVPYQMQVADRMFHDAEEHPTANWTTTDILAESSNIGTIKIAQQLGKDRLDKFQRAFGYGSITALAIPGEAKGIIHDPKDYSGTTLGATAIGQGVSVSAIQMLSVYNTIANKGIYVPPKLALATIDNQGNTHPMAPSDKRRVISEQTAQQMNLMMQEVVRKGTATAARIDGYEVAGKTGTASKPRTDGLGYETGAYMASFAGFVPAAKPEFTAIVMIDEPRPIIFGGLVAAPVFADITRYALQSYVVAPVAWGDNRYGVPLMSETAKKAAGTADAKPGTTAEEAAAILAAAASVNTSTTSSTSTTSTTIRRR